MSADAPPEEAVGVTDVIKRYRDGETRIDAIAGIRLSVPRAQMWALLGPSGSGKSTLLGLLGGLILPTRGDARVAGRSVVHMRDHHRTRWRREHVGFVFQELSLIPRMSLLENILLPLVPEGGGGEAAVERALALLKRVGLDDRAHSSVERLSGGERQRGAIVRALIGSPQVLLLDEPTAHVDAENARIIIRILAELRDEGRTVVASTHDPRFAEDPAIDRSVAILRGRLDEPSR